MNEASTLIHALNDMWNSQNIDRLAWEWTMSGTHAGDFPNLPATGRTFTIEGVSILEVKDGLVQSQRDFYDQASFLRQVGALPEGVEHLRVSSSPAVPTTRR